MARILLLCGSLQRVSANRAALDIARAALTARGIEVTDFEALESIPPMNPDRADSPGEAVLSLRAGIGSADAVLIAAPEYAGALAGAMKNALDWIVGTGELYRKPIALVSAGTSGGLRARRDLVRTLCWQGAHILATLGIAAPNTKSETSEDGSRRFTDPTTIQEIESLALSLAASIHQRPSERLPAMKSLAIDAGVDPTPLIEQIAAQEENEADPPAGDPGAPARRTPLSR
jgi:NAD(P)H-dependent FMN reductase